mgnify:FL=1
MKSKFQFRVKRTGIEHILTIEAEDKFKAMNTLDAMYPREDGYSHSLIFNDEVCG